MSSRSRSGGPAKVFPASSTMPPLGEANGSRSANGVSHDYSNGFYHGSCKAATKALANGQSPNRYPSPYIGKNGLAHCHVDSDDEDDFYGAEERSCCSDSDFQDARDVADFGSDSEGSSASQPGLRLHGSYRNLVVKLQEEQARCAALEASLSHERLRLRELEGGSVHAKLLGENGTSAPKSAHFQNGALPSDRQDCDQSSAEAEVVVARMVAEAIGKAAGRAEAAKELEAELQQKERELSRLRDKLQYWERMNQEMSQQNTHAIELLRKRRRIWKTVYRATYVAGAAILAVGLIAALNLASTSFSNAPQSSEDSSSGANPSE